MSEVHRQSHLDEGKARADSIPASGNLAIICCLICAAFRIWCCLCAFPSQEWNDVRLRATFLIVDGLPLYPGLDAGLMTTWIYGPVMPLLMLPTALASTIDSALLIAGALNTGLLLGAFAFACLWWPQPMDRPWPFTLRLGVLGVSLLLLPQNFFIFLQADNASLACGLVSLTCLARAQVRDKTHWWWLAAGFAGATAFSKLHGVTLLAAEIGWLWFAHSRSRAVQFELRLIPVCLGLLLVTLWLSPTPQAAWAIIITIPSRLPFTSVLLRQLALLAPYYGLMVLLPGLLVLLVYWRHRQLASWLGLSTSVWLASLPLGIAGSLTSGGGYNSLHGAFYLLPIALMVLGSSGWSQRTRLRRVSLALWLIGPTVLLALDATNILQLPKTPDTVLPIEAALISSEGKDRIWIPWRPLATRFATGRHVHDEDGLYVRQLTGLFPKYEHAFAYLPPRWNRTLFQEKGMNWNVALSMQHTSNLTMKSFGHWIWILSSTSNPKTGNSPIERP